MNHNSNISLIPRSLFIVQFAFGHLDNGLYSIYVICKWEKKVSSSRSLLELCLFWHVMRMVIFYEITSQFCIIAFTCISRFLGLIKSILEGDVVAQCSTTPKFKVLPKIRIVIPTICGNSTGVPCRLVA